MPSQLRYHRSSLPVYLLTLILTVCISCTEAATAADPKVTQALAKLKLPAGLRIEQFSDVSKWGSPRMLALDKQGRLLVSLPDQGRIIRLNQQADVELIAQGLNAPHGIALLGDDLLVAEQSGVVRLPRQGDRWGAPQAFIRNLPDGGHSLKR